MQEQDRLIIKTDRLLLNPFACQDLDLLHQTFTNSFVREYLWDNEVIAISQTRDILIANESSFSTGQWGLWKVIVLNDKSYAGFAGLWKFFDENQPQLLYGLMPDKTGFGYATEAGQAIINYSFDVLNFDFLSASCDTGHRASRSVCERLGMYHVKDEILNARLTSFYQVNRR